MASAACAFFLLASGPAFAQQGDDGSAASYWTRERERVRSQARPGRVVQRPTHLIRRAAPRRGYVREDAAEGAARSNPASEIEAADGARPAPVVEAPTNPAPVVGPAFTIAVLGDNIGTMLAQGLQETFANQPNVTILRKARENTGLVRDDYFDWTKAARDLVASPERIDAIVLMLGSNDRQALRDGAASVDPRLPRWRELYAERAQNLVKILREKNVPLLWVGMPVMKNERLSNGLLELNEIYRETASQNGATYIDVWEAFVDDRQQFALYGPDLNGAITKLRAGDGVHFTRAGARKLAYFVEGDVRRLIEKQTPVVDPAIADGAPLERAPEPDQKSQQLAIPAPPAIVLPLRPDKGPVVPLTGLALSPGGELAGSARKTDQRDQQSRAIVEQVLIEGRPMEQAPTGRADDFRWPRR